MSIMSSMKTQKIAGILIFVSFMITIYAYFINNQIFIYSGIFAWISLILLFRFIIKKVLLYTLISFSVLLFIFSYINQFEIDFSKSLSWEYKKVSDIKNKILRIDFCLFI